MKAYDLALAERGTVEWKDGSNPKVIAYFRDAGHPEVTEDATAWCAAFVGAMLHRAGMPNTGKLNARSYLEWGKPVARADARPGDVCIFERGTGWQGHVGFLHRDDGHSLMILGGNQGDAVNIRPQPEGKLLGIRRAESSPVDDGRRADPAVNDDDTPMMTSAGHQAGKPVQAPAPVPAPSAPDDAGGLWAAFWRGLAAWLKRGET